MVAGAVVKVGGTDLSAENAAKLAEVRVEQHLMLPSTFLVRLWDDDLSVVDSSLFDVGKSIEILMQAPEASSFSSVLKGEITAIEVDLEHARKSVAARGFDRAHRLHREKKYETFLDSTYSDIATRVIQGAGLQAGTVDSAGGTQEFVQRSNETAFEFLWRLAARLDFEVVVDDQQVHFRKAGGPGTDGPELNWGKNLMTFRPRVTSAQGIDQVEVTGWDPKRAQPIVSTQAASTVDDRLPAKIGLQRNSVASGGGKFGAGKFRIGDRIVADQGEADALAKSAMAKLANTFVEATGQAQGNPALKAGVKVDIKKVGTKFSGKYTLTEVVHVYKGEQGYLTNFRISGRARRGIVDVMSKTPKRDWGSSVVIGVVVDNKDPKNLGRVKVKYPTLSSKEAGWWARIASPSAGKDRGLLMLPVVGDEVLVAFESDDTRRPYVIGSVWNGQGLPGQLVDTKGSFVIQSDQKIQMKAKEPISVKGDKEMKVETTGAISQKTSDSLKIEASSNIDMKASSSVAMKAGTDVAITGGTNVSVKASAKLELTGSGMVVISGGVIKIG
jgi:phage protein D